MVSGQNAEQALVLPVVTLRQLLGAGILAFAIALLALPGVGWAEGRGKPKPPAGAHKRVARKSPRKTGAKGCKRQKPKPFLVRSYFIRNGQLRGDRHRKALRYRAERYGSVEGAGLEAWADHTAISQAASTTFMGLPIRVHKKIVKKLRCVERTIRKSCTGKGQRYVPRAIGGFREQNTYRGGEVSNHLFGIAIDIDPDRNPCCGCVDPWPTHPACTKDAKSPFEMSELPRCWVDAFEQQGFYWLGRDTLRDTMHFEFLGDPDQ